MIFSKRNDIDPAIAAAQELGSKYYTVTYQPQTREITASSARSRLSCVIDRHALGQEIMNGLQKVER
jgi:hypothetical protein